MRLIESDGFSFEFLSQLAERESWRKEVHRPVYHVHKWWAKRLGSVFRGILLGCALPQEADLAQEFYRSHALSELVVFDPFMGSGTTVGEAHKLGLAALGRDINPVAVEAVATALGPMDRQKILEAFHALSETVGEKIRRLYRSIDSRERACDVLYYFWVMQADCPSCDMAVDLFSSYVIAKNAYPDRKPEVQILCPSCGDIFPGLYGQKSISCRSCHHKFDPSKGPARGASASCSACNHEFAIIKAISAKAMRPSFRLYGKLVLTLDDQKEYLPASPEDLAAYDDSSATLRKELKRKRIKLPELRLEHGHNTRQAMSYGFRAWRDFFNDRQLLALAWLQDAISKLEEPSTRRVLMSLFSGVLEFNNLFASYKGEGTGAVRHIFSHHILKPERTPIEANIWGTHKSSGSFSNLFRSRLLRALDYRDAPAELNGKTGQRRLCAPPFSGDIRESLPLDGQASPRGIYLSCGDSANTGLPVQSVDMVVTDPPFFDNVHYSELADFFFAWQQLSSEQNERGDRTTRNASEVQDADPSRFAEKLRLVFREAHRILRDEGLLVFTYHHSREDGWTSLAEAILGANFIVVNAHPVKAEMTGATPKSRAKEPIQLDVIVVCRKRSTEGPVKQASVHDALASSRAKLERLQEAGFALSRNDRKVVLYGQLLTTLSSASDFPALAATVLTICRPAANREA